MWQIFQFLIYISFISNTISQEDIPAIDQLPEKSPAELRPCLLTSKLFAENEGGYLSLLEDCNPFDRYKGHPPKYVDGFRGIAPMVRFIFWFEITRSIKKKKYECLLNRDWKKMNS